MPDRSVACVSRRASVVALVVLMVVPLAARGQVFAGDGAENYLRYLQTFRAVPLYPWGVRAFSPAELDRLFPSDTSLPGRLPSRTRSFNWIDPDASARVNTGFPYGYNDGPIWAGRGLTLAMEGGFVMRRGVLSLTVAPLAFVSQNARFKLMPNGEAGKLAFADGSNPTSIDQPQRFGNGMYARLDPGQSTVRVDWHAVAAGISTANQYWGPATEFPIILGNNAPGFPHLFVGTARPLDLWLVRVHGRLIWGRLSQSAFSADTASAGLRFGTGMVLDLTTRWIPGLEIGATRFSHRPWPRNGFTTGYLLQMLRGGQGSGGIVNMRDDNQLASAFFRWALPNSGFEVYGEYGRDDYNSNLRDFLEEPDHIGGYTIGFRKVARRSDNRLLGVRAEVSNLQFSSIAQGRPWAPFYTHENVTQGHTELGQVLGSESGVGGAGAVIAIDSYTRSGRWTWSATRLLRQQRGDPSGTNPDPNGVDVQYGLTVERQQFRGAGSKELLARVTGVYELNRDYSRDAFNVNVAVGMRLRLGRAPARKKPEPLIATTESKP